MGHVTYVRRAYTGIVILFFRMYQVPCGTLGAIWHSKPCLAFEDSTDL
jgi:hypothetical protein